VYLRLNYSFFNPAQPVLTHLFCGLAHSGTDFLAQLNSSIPRRPQWLTSQ